MDYYIFRDGREDMPPTNWQSKFGGRAWEYVPSLKKWYLHLFDVTQADLNWDNPRVREELKEIIRFWKKKGVKGFRFDVVNLISKPECFEDDIKGDGWNAPFWCNHDQPRIVSRMGDEGIYYKESAKMLAGMIHFMRGTPYIYQGEEIGMLNAHFSSIEQYRDVESLNYYEILLEEGKTEKEALEMLAARSRDNSRTPMQWNEGMYGGFSETKTWIPVAAGFRKEITAEAQQKDEDSILAFYKKLIAMRKKYPVIAKGDISFLETGTDMTLAYQRTLEEQQILVLCNLGGKKQDIQITREWSSCKILLGNYPLPEEVCQVYHG